jgi:hypothetical protein
VAIFHVVIRRSGPEFDHSLPLVIDTIDPWTIRLDGRQTAG